MTNTIGDKDPAIAELKRDARPYNIKTLGIAAVSSVALGLGLEYSKSSGLFAASKVVGYTGTAWAIGRGIFYGAVVQHAQVESERHEIASRYPIIKPGTTYESIMTRLKMMELEPETDDSAYRSAVDLLLRTFNNYSSTIGRESFAVPLQCISYELALYGKYQDEYTKDKLSRSCEILDKVCPIDQDKDTITPEDPTDKQKRWSLFIKSNSDEIISLHQLR